MMAYIVLHAASGCAFIGLEATASIPCGQTRPFFCQLSQAPFDFLFFGLIGPNTEPPPWWLLGFPPLLLLLIFIGPWIFPVPGWKEYKNLVGSVTRGTLPGAILRHALIQSSVGTRGIFCTVAICQDGLEIYPLYNFRLAHGRLFIPWVDLNYVGRKRLLLQKRDFFFVRRNSRVFLQLSFPLWSEEIVQKRIRSRLS